MTIETACILPGIGEVLLRPKGVVLRTSVIGGKRKLGTSVSDFIRMFSTFPTCADLCPINVMVTMYSTQGLTLTTSSTSSPPVSVATKGGLNS